jgi:hypothetical protein
MSIPDTINYFNNNILFFSRQSEYEKTPFLYENCSGIWLDSFEGNWFDKYVVLDHLNEHKKVVIVSSELHSRDHKDLWDFIRINKLHIKENIILCTDFPEDAKKYFNL